MATTIFDPKSAPLALTLSRFESGANPAVGMQVIFDDRLETYLTTSVSTSSMSANMNAGAVRRIRLGEARILMIRKALLDNGLGGLTSDPAIKALLTGRPGRRPAAAKIDNPDSELLTRVGNLAKVARLTGDYPFKSVESAFSLSRDESQRLLKRARKEGYA